MIVPLPKYSHCRRCANQNKACGACDWLEDWAYPGRFAEILKQEGEAKSMSPQ